ncbi:MAG: hypothetical protein P9M14_08950 [Candidatus Alcyoniella australis]|nr:hypothetical protein [Candidatus Alcyoniella australis]
MNNVAYSEHRRKAEHIAPIAFAFLLKYLPIWLALVLAVLSVIYGIVGSKLLIKDTMREDERLRGYSAGKIAYGAMVLLLILVFHTREQMWIVAGAWSIMAFGDAFANLFGVSYGEDKLPWNRDKSWIGTLAFVFFGILGSVMLIGWFTWLWPVPGMPLLNGGQIWTIAVVASLCCAIVESLPLPVVDNITVPACGALVIWLLQLKLA